MSDIKNLQLLEGLLLVYIYRFGSYIGFISAIYETVKFMTEVPFGILGDKYGIKFSMISSVCLAAITWGLLFLKISF